MALFVAAYGIWWTSHHRSMERRRRVPVPHKTAVLTELLELVSTTADRIGVPLILLYGTLLGWYRHRDFLCHDFDVDLGVVGVAEFDRLWDEIEKTVDRHLYCPTAYRWGTFVRYFKITHRPTELNIDVMCMILDPPHIYQCVPAFYSRWFLGECRHRIPSHWFQPLRPASLRGRAVWVPNHPIAVLGCYYGPDFVIPDMRCDANCEHCRRRAKE